MTLTAPLLHRFLKKETDMAIARPSRNQASVASRRLKSAAHEVAYLIERGAFVRDRMEELLNEIDGCSAIVRDYAAPLPD